MFISGGLLLVLVIWYDFSQSKKEGERAQELAVGLANKLRVGRETGIKPILTECEEKLFMAVYNANR